jgi:hypothetical protein
MRAAFDRSVFAGGSQGSRVHRHAILCDNYRVGGNADSRATANRAPTVW